MSFQLVYNAKEGRDRSLIQAASEKGLKTTIKSGGFFDRKKQYWVMVIIIF